MTKTPDPITNYVLRWYQRFVTPGEQRLMINLGILVQDESGESSIELREAAKRGADATKWKDVGEFRDFVAARILREHANEVIVLRCPKCSALAASPKARLCLSCGLDWH